MRTTNEAWPSEFIPRWMVEEQQSFSCGHGDWQAILIVSAVHARKQASCKPDSRLYQMMYAAVLSVGQVIGKPEKGV